MQQRPIPGSRVQVLDHEQATQHDQEQLSVARPEVHEWVEAEISSPKGAPKVKFEVRQEDPAPGALLEHRRCGTAPRDDLNVPQDELQASGGRANGKLCRIRC